MIPFSDRWTTLFNDPCFRSFNDRIWTVFFSDRWTRSRLGFFFCLFIDRIWMIPFSARWTIVSSDPFSRSLNDSFQRPLFSDRWTMVFERSLFPTVERPYVANPFFRFLSDRVCTIPFSDRWMTVFTYYPLFRSFNGRIHFSFFPIFERSCLHDPVFRSFTYPFFPDRWTVVCTGPFFGRWLSFSTISFSRIRAILFSDGWTIVFTDPLFRSLNGHI